MIMECDGVGGDDENAWIGGAITCAHTVSAVVLRDLVLVMVCRCGAISTDDLSDGDLIDDLDPDPDDD